MMNHLWELLLLYVVLLEDKICQVAGSCRNPVRAEGLKKLTFIPLFMLCNSLTFGGELWDWYRRHIVCIALWVICLTTTFAETRGWDVRRRRKGGQLWLSPTHKYQSCTPTLFLSAALIVSPKRFSKSTLPVPSTFTISQKHLSRSD